VRHTQYAVKVLIKYHLMEEGRQRLEALLDWAAATPFLHALWQRQGRHGSPVQGPKDWVKTFVQDLARGGALSLDGPWAVDAPAG
jgi:hypothetical protein